MTGSEFKDRFVKGLRRHPIVYGVASIFLLLVVIGSVAGTKPHSTRSSPSTTASSAPRAGSSTVTSSTEEDTSGPGAPTIDGSVAAAGSGNAPGASACRAGNPLANVYHPNRLLVKSPCTTVSGTVESIRSEDDGDVHFDIALDSQYANLLTPENTSQQHGWLVDEIVPADEPGCTPGTPPRPATGSYDYGICTGADERTPTIGSHVFVTGPYVLDEDHGGWAEIHPVWAVSTSLAATTTTTAPTPTTSPPITASPTTAPPPPGPSHSCTASMSNPTPGAGGYDTVNVSSNVPNAPVTITKHYKTTTSSDSGTTDANGAASITFNIGHPTVGYTVEVDVSINNGEASCSTSFTPQ